VPVALVPKVYDPIRYCVESVCHWKITLFGLCLRAKGHFPVDTIDQAFTKTARMACGSWLDAGRCKRAVVGDNSTATGKGKGKDSDTGQINQTR